MKLTDYGHLPEVISFILRLTAGAGAPSVSRDTARVTPRACHVTLPSAHVTPRACHVVLLTDSFTNIS